MVILRFLHAIPRDFPRPSNNLLFFYVYHTDLTSSDRESIPSVIRSVLCTTQYDTMSLSQSTVVSTGGRQRLLSLLLLPRLAVKTFRRVDNGSGTPVEFLQFFRLLPALVIICPPHGHIEILENLFFLSNPPTGFSFLNNYRLKVMF